MDGQMNKQTSVTVRRLLRVAFSPDSDNAHCATLSQSHFIAGSQCSHL